MKKSNLAIGWLHRDAVHPLFMSSVQRIRDAEDGYVPTINIHSGPKVDFARNELFRVWLTETSAPRLLMLDDDMSYPQSTAKRLRSHNKDIVGGIYFLAGWNSPVKPAITKAYETEQGMVIGPYWDYPVDQLVEVTGLGGGFMMVTRRAAEEIWDARGETHPMPWFAHGMHLGVPIGEDVAFCLTAQKCGFSVWCDTGLEADHMKSMPINQRSYIASLSDESHPCYTQREGIPIYQKASDGHSSNTDRPSPEGLSETHHSRLVDFGPDS